LRLRQLFNPLLQILRPLGFFLLRVLGWLRRALLGLLGWLLRAQLLPLLVIDLSAGARGAALAEHLAQVLPGFDQLSQGRLLQAAGVRQVLLFQLGGGRAHGGGRQFQAANRPDSLRQLLSKLRGGPSQFAFRLGQSSDVLGICFQLL
jgi:hypothetical protein